MASLAERVPAGVQAGFLRAAFALPKTVQRLIVGKPVHLDGQELHIDVQLLLKLQQLSGQAELGGSGTPDQVRAGLRASAAMIDAQKIGPVSTRDLKIPTEDGTIGARFYEPEGLGDKSPLLVYIHGGGFVVGDIESHDNLCRFLAKHAEVRVLSVDYRLAPENKFPAGVRDCYAAFRWAHTNAAELNIDPEKIAVGGDSAGGNLTATTALQAIAQGGPKPKFLLMFYPTVDASVRRRSREIFGKGFFLTDAGMDWFFAHYVAKDEEKFEPLCSPLLAEDLSQLPPVYLSTAGFDPLRDEGEAFVAKLREQGVPVAHTRHRGLIHGYASMLTVGTACREATFEAVGALRAGLSL
ncbi:alpha/beta hydrolase [Pseudonocardiaceae bacterium YIM PH 21723]|nr:alpha/beta hydrolase [Pseudonocardiaceae bacterium YIM PH 21723]